MQNIRNMLSFSLHEPERLIGAAQSLADANLRELDRIGRIIRGRDLRHALRGELGGQRDSAATLHSSFVHLLSQLGEDYTPTAGMMTNPQGSRARHIIFLLKQENNDLHKTATAALASLEGRRLLDPSIRAVVVGALSRVDGRLTMLVSFCNAAIATGAIAAPTGDLGSQDPDDQP